MSIKNYEEELMEDKIYKEIKIEQEKIKLEMLKKQLKLLEDGKIYYNIQQDIF